MATLEAAQETLRKAIVDLAKDYTKGGSATATSAEAAKNLAIAHRLLSKEPVEYDVADSIG